MALTQTVTLVTPGTTEAPSAPTAAQINDLNSALDEILQARFGSRSFLAFAVGTAPGLEAGDRFRFGTATNLQQLIADEYDVADETPAAPTAPEVVSWDVTTKVVWVTGIAEVTTLNRQWVNWTPPAGVAADYWFGWIRPQRFEPLRLADIQVEDYTDPVEATTTDFTFREHWDRHGCVRIHNGNRFDLTVKFESGVQADLVIPPYGIRIGRRTTPDGVFDFSKYYIAPTVAGDEMRWNKPHDGQFAASLELAADLCEEIAAGSWVRSVSVPLDDQTALDASKFAGSTVASTDYLADWLAHKGKFLSVVLDKRDGAVVVDELTYNGVASLPDAAWSGKVTCELDVTDTYMEFTTDATPPAGAADAEWEHDLIPISTNVIGLLPRSIKTTYSQDPSILSNGSGAASQPLVRWLLGPEDIATTTTDIYEPRTSFSTSGGVGFTVSDAAVENVSTSVLTGFGNLMSNPSSLPIAGSAPAGFDLGGEEGHYRCLGALCSYQTLTLDGTEWTTGPTQLDYNLLRWAKTDAPGTLHYTRLAGIGPSATLRHFAARIPRRYHSSGSVVGGFAVHGNHPSDSAVAGTTDGLGGQLGWTPARVRTSQIAIEGVAWDQEETVGGRDVMLPADALHWVAENIRTPGWWDTNRAAIMAGTVPEEAKLLTWRIGRQAAEFNAYATIVNSTREVINVDIRDLHADPLPSVAQVLPFGGWAAPVLWGAGRYDTDSQLANWLTAWGLTDAGAVPDIAGLRGTTRQVWVRLSDQIHVGDPDPSGHDETVTYSIVAQDYSTWVTTETTSTVGGETFSNWEVWSEAGMVHMFGAAYSDADYLWVTRGEMASTFAGLGLSLPPDLCGEKFTPQHATASAVSLVAGTVLGSASTQPEARCEDVDYDGWLGDETAYPIRNPFAASPTWVRVLPDLVPFRISEPVGVDAPTFGSEESDGTEFGTQDVIHQATFTTAEKKCLWQGSRRTLPRLDSDTGAEAWVDVQHIYCARETLLVASPEPLFHREFVDATFDWSLETTAPASYEVVVLTIPANTTVDVAYIQANGLPTASAYHCQFLRRTGVTRTL